MENNGELLAVLVGCGGMANQWVKTAMTTPGLKLVGLVDVRREAAEQMAQRHGLAGSIVYNTLAEALKQAEPHIVFDVTIPEAHDQVTIDALRGGCHVLGEKPMSDTLAKAQAMVATAQKLGKTYAVIQNRRYDPNIRAVRKTLVEGKIGNVEEVHADFYIGAHFGGFRDVMDDVLIVDMAIHTFDAARFISGADPVSVYCHSFNPRHSWYKGDASAICIFEMSDGIVFSYRGSWCAEGLMTTWESSWRVIGSQGTLTWDGAAGIKCQALKPDGKKGFHSEMIDVPVAVEPLEHRGHEGLIHEFVQCVRSGRKPQTTCEDNIKSLAMVLAAVQSRKEGRKVPVRW